MRILSIAILYMLLLALLSACSKPSSSTRATGTASAPTPTEAAETGIYCVAAGGDDAGPGTIEQPWATIEHAARVLEAGERVYIRGGTYRIAKQVRLQHSGRADAWIEYAAYPGEVPVIDAQDVDVFPPAGTPPYPHDQGAFQIEGLSYIRVRNLTLRNSHNAGFTVRDSRHVELINLVTDTTFSSGIAVWDTDHDGQGCEQIVVLGNTVTRANTYDMLLPGRPRGRETPHEAITIAGAQYFEVAYNHVYDCDKEGIDVKETSSHGTVHHNYVHHVDRQGLYVDSWFGVLEDVELYENVVHDCRGAGIVVSVEGGKEARDIRIHHNLVYDNLGTGIFFSRWGDGPRTNIQVYNNTVHHNGYGPANPGTDYHWITGGLYLFSTNLQDVEIRSNILSDNKGFQIGYSDHYLKLGDDIHAILAEKRIVIAYNLVHDRNNVTYPIYAGWSPDSYADIYAMEGEHAVIGDPLFVDAGSGDFFLGDGSPAFDAGSPAVDFADPDGSRNDIGALPAGAGADREQWWRTGFPPQLDVP